MFEYLRYGLTRDMNQIPSLCRLRIGSLADNDARMTAQFRNYLIGNDAALQANPETDSNADKQRKVPWKKELDGKMFYL